MIAYEQIMSKSKEELVNWFDIYARRYKALRIKK